MASDPRNTDLPPEIRAMTLAMDAVFGAINAAPQDSVSARTEVCRSATEKVFSAPADDTLKPAVAAPLDGSDGVVERGPVRSTKPALEGLRESVDTACATIDRLRDERKQLVAALRDLIALDDASLDHEHSGDFGGAFDPARKLLRELGEAG